MWPLNSTPRMGLAPGGMGYFPSRWSRSIRFSPKAFTFTSTLSGASVSLGVGASPMYRALDGPMLSRINTARIVSGIDMVANVRMGRRLNLYAVGHTL